MPTTTFANLPDGFNLMAIFDQAYANSQSAIGSWFSAVTDFGCDPKGVSDSTTAINNAITAANNAGGGIVYFPVGTFVISSQISVPPKVSLIGCGSADDIINETPITSLKASSSFPKSVAMVSFQSNWCGRFENFVIDGNSKVATRGVAWTSARFATTRNIFVKAMGNNASTDACYSMTDAGTLSMASCLFEHLGIDQFGMAAGTHGLVINGTTGFGVTECTFINCSFVIPAGSAYALQITGPSGTDTSDNNWFLACNFSNSSATFQTAQLVNCQEHRFVACTLVNPNGSGNAVYVKNNGADNIFTNCYFNSGAANYSIDTNGKLTFDHCTQNDVLYGGATNPISSATSPQTYTNNTPVPVQLYWNAVTFSAITITRAGNNTGISNSSLTATLAPRDSISFTFSAGTLVVSVLPLA